MNLLLISLDTTRADHLGCYGWDRCTSPTLDDVARQGALFERCISPSIPTHPAHTSMLTGRDAMAHQIVAQGGKNILADTIPLLPELLGRRGFWTGAADNLGRWFSRGFDRYRTYSWSRDPSGSWRKGEAVTRAALDVLDEAARQPRPFFIFLHYWDPHTPYLPPPPFHRMFYGGDERDPACDTMREPLSFAPFMHYFRQWLDGVTDIRFPMAEYDASIAYMDTCLHHVFQKLEDLGIADETLVAVTADHGEELDEHRMWFDHHGLYDTNLHVPLILRLPGTIPAATRVPGPVRLFDLAPTLLDFAGFPEDAAGMEGRSLRPAAEGSGTAPAGEAPIFLTECTWMRKRGVRTPEWKLIVARDHPDIHGRPPVELYDLRVDPGEQKNLAEERPDVVAALREELEAWRCRRIAETGLPDPIEEQEITLRSIGTPPATRVSDG